jgi:23S rRNA pseudouridine955/2504/2580 synthase
MLILKGSAPRATSTGSCAAAIRRNGGRSAGRAPAVGDRLRVPPIRAAPAPAAAARTGPAEVAAVPPVLYEDDALLALDKPSGLAVHGGSGIAFGVIERLRRARPSARFLELVHRLDRDTSGILLVAKKRAALTALHAACARGGSKSTTSRWCAGAGAMASGLSISRLDVRHRRRRAARARRRQRARRAPLPLVRQWRDADRRWRADAEPGPAARTRSASPDAPRHPGRRRQVRRLRLESRTRTRGLRRMFLHAHRIRFAHPVDGREIVVESPLPADLARFVARLDEDDRAGAHA